MGKNDERKHVHDLAVFALKVLVELEGCCPNDVKIAYIEEQATHMGLGMPFYRRTERGKQFEDSWYGPRCVNKGTELPPQPGDHIERDLH